MRSRLDCASHRAARSVRFVVLPPWGNRMQDGLRTGRGVALALAVILAIVPAAGTAHARTRKPAPRPGVGAAGSAGSALTPASFQVERHTLKNGLVVLTHEDHSVPTCTFWQWFKVGSRNERPGITGI